MGCNVAQCPGLDHKHGKRKGDRGMHLCDSKGNVAQNSLDSSLAVLPLKVCFLLLAKLLELSET